jgi:hypothetical protein
MTPHRTRQAPHTRFRRHAFSDIGRRHHLTGSDRYVLYELADRADFLSWSWQGSASEMAESTGLDRNSIAAAVARLAKAKLVTIVEPFRQWGKAVIKVDCYDELVVDAKQPAASIAGPPAIDNAGRIAGRIAGTPATAPDLNSIFAEASNGATEKAVGGAQVERKDARGELRLNGSARASSFANERDGPVRQVGGEAVPFTCPDCGGWPCQCLF